jgi:hypothetical protein
MWADVVDWYQVKFKDKKKNIGTITNGKKYKNV